MKFIVLRYFSHFQRNSFLLVDISVCHKVIYWVIYWVFTEAMNLHCNIHKCLFYYLSHAFLALLGLIFYSHNRLLILQSVLKSQLMDILPSSGFIASLYISLPENKAFQYKPNISKVAYWDAWAQACDKMWHFPLTKISNIASSRASLKHSTLTNKQIVRLIWWIFHLDP